MKSASKTYKSIRLPFFDYSEARYYFFTVCTARREHIFGEIRDGEMHLNDFGAMVLSEWEKSASIRPDFVFDAFVIMPNHIHGLVGIVGTPEKDRAHSSAALHADARRSSRDRAPRSLSSYLAQFKATINRRINEARNSPGQPVWQPGYYEHIVRANEKLEAARTYIESNPQNWFKDEENVRL